MIIGLSGKKQSGKDTACRIIQWLLLQYQNRVQKENSLLLQLTHKEDMSYLDAYGWERKLFAGKLKQIVFSLIGCTMEQLEDNEFKETPLGEEWEVKYLWNGYRGNLPQLTLDKENKYPHIQPQKLTPRKMLQLFGTDAGREFVHPNIWVNALMSDYKPIGRGSKHAYRHGPGWKYMKHEEVAKDLWDTDVKYPETNTYFFDIMPNWIITDVRFPNEVEAIKSRGGVVIRVERKFQMEEINNGDGTITLGMNPQAFKIDLHESETALDNYGGFSPHEYKKGGFDYILYNRGSFTDAVTDVKAILQDLNLIKL